MREERRQAFLRECERREAESERLERERKARQDRVGRPDESLRAEITARLAALGRRMEARPAPTEIRSIPKAPRRKSNRALLDEWFFERNARDEERAKGRRGAPSSYESTASASSREQRRDQDAEVRRRLEEQWREEKGEAGHARSISLSLDALLVSPESPKVTAFDLSHSQINRLGRESVFARMLKQQANRTVNKWPHLTDSKDGDDLIQVALLAVLDAMDAYRGESQFFTYAETVIERAMSRYARRKQSRLTKGELPDETMTTFADPHDILEQKESIRDLLLATKDTDFVLLHAIGYRDAELGEPNVIKVKRHRAKKKLRQELGLIAE